MASIRVFGQRRPHYIKGIPMATKNVTETPAGDNAAAAAVRNKISAEQVAKVRELRNTAKADDATKCAYTHKQVADMVGLTPGTVSMIARNKSHVDPAYTPIYDGKQDHGPRKPKTDEVAEGKAQADNEAAEDAAAAEAAAVADQPAETAETAEA